MQSKNGNECGVVVMRTAVWTFWVCTFYAGYLLAQATF